MAGLFAKAAAKSKPAATTTSKGVTFHAGDPEGEQVAKSVHELVRLSADAKAIDAKMGVHKTNVKKFAEAEYLKTFAATQVSPDTPLKVQNNDGESVTFVVQDRCGQYKVKEEQGAALNALLGADAAAELLYEETSFKLNRDVLAVKGVMPVLEKALESAMKKLVKDKVLTGEQADCLLDVDVKTSFKPGTLGRLAMICGANVTKMEQFLKAMGSSCTRYIKV